MTRHEFKKFLLHVKRFKEFDEFIFNIKGDYKYEKNYQHFSDMYLNIVDEVYRYHIGKTEYETYKFFGTPTNPKDVSGWLQGKGFIPDRISDLIYGIDTQPINLTISQLSYYFTLLEERVLEYKKINLKENE